MNICLYSTDPAAGHAVGLAIGMRRYGNVNAVYDKKDKHGCGYLDTNAKYGMYHIKNHGDVFIIVGCAAYDSLIKTFRRKKLAQLLATYHRVVVIVTDGIYMRQSTYYNAIFRHFDLYCTPCKIQFADGHAKEYYQPIGDLDFIPRGKTAKISLSHAPFKESKHREKGSGLIINAFKKTGLPYDIITGDNWTSGLRRKAKSHIHVDQVTHYDAEKFNWRGGVGKNGYEAMMLGCATLSWGKHEGIQLPPPPVVWCDKYDLIDVLQTVIDNNEYRMEVINKQLDWAKNYLTYDFATRWVLGM